MPDSPKATGAGELTLRQFSRRNQGNRVVGGFAMTMVEVELRLDGKAPPV